MRIGRLAQNIACHYAHKGNKFIRSTLNQRKINSEQINTALLDIPDEYTRAWEETKKRLTHTFQLSSKNEQINTITRFLSGRQFSHFIITEIINKLNSKGFDQVQALENLHWSKAS